MFNRKKTNSAVSIKGDKFIALPREKVSEPTRSPYVVWSKKYRIIVDGCNDMTVAKKLAKKYNKKTK